MKPLLWAILMVAVPATLAGAQTATVNWNNVDQVIDGFGASNASGFDATPAVLSPSQATFFFGTGAGDIGLTLLRGQVPALGNCTTVSAACVGDAYRDFQLAIAASSQVRIWAAPWSPPAMYKTNKSTICNRGSESGSLIPEGYADYATYLANYVKSLSSLYGIQLYALSIQNEPDYCPSGYEGAVWSGASLDEFIKTNLGPTFASAHLTTLIMMPESSRFENFAALAGTTMEDSLAEAYVGINAWHDYDYRASVINPYALQGKRYWETEASAGQGYGPSACGGCWDPSMADALWWAEVIDNRLVDANANAWHYWSLVGGLPNDNEALIGGPKRRQIARRAYVLGNYSLFVRPGFYRIDATHIPQNGVLVSAYKNSSTGQLVIVAINQKSSKVTQTFTLNGVTVPSVTPWITSAKFKLAQQPNVAVQSGLFTYVLPGHSVTTFVGSSSLD